MMPLIFAVICEQYFNAFTKDCQPVEGWQSYYYGKQAGASEMPAKMGQPLLHHHCSRGKAVSIAGY